MLNLCATKCGLIQDQLNSCKVEVLLYTVTCFIVKQFVHKKNLTPHTRLGWTSVRSMHELCCPTIRPTGMNCPQQKQPQLLYTMTFYKAKFPTKCDKHPFPDTLLVSLTDITYYVLSHKAKTQSFYLCAGPLLSIRQGQG